MDEKRDILGPGVDAEIDDELRFHLEMMEAELRTRGMSAAEAREATLSAFGDPDEVRRWLRRHDRRTERRRARIALGGSVVQDVRLAARKLRSQLGFTAVAVLTLGLGIGGVTAVFSAVDAILLRPLPFADADRLVRVELGVPTALPGLISGSRMPDAADLDALPDQFSSWTAYAPGGLNLTGLGEPLRVRVALVSSGFFASLGVAPATGRAFTDGDGEPSSRAAILSDGLARRHFSEPRRALGGTIELNGRAHEVVGTMAPGFGFPADADVWLPLRIPFPWTEDGEAFRQYLPSTVVARLAPGATIESADARIRDLYAPDRIEQRSRQRVRPLRDVFVADREQGVKTLFGATTLLLLVACVNVASLLLSRATARRPEIAMRRLLGATPARIVQQLTIESILLAVAGGVLGVLIAYLATPALDTLVPERLVGAVRLAVDVRVLGFALLVVLGTALAFGLWPALQLAKSEPAGAARDASGRATDERRVLLGRRILVAAEIATAMMLLIGTGVAIRGFAALLSVEAGVRPEGVATLELSLSEATYGDREQRRRFVREVLARLEADPRVSSAAFVNELPMRGVPGISLTVGAEGRAPPDGASRPFAQHIQVTPGYFEALGIAILRGRTFADVTGDGPGLEIIVNQRLAEMLWPGQDPIGSRMTSPIGDTPLEVVGVVRDVKSFALDNDFVPQMYTELLPTPYPGLALVGRSELSAEELAGLLVEAVRAVEPTQAVYNVQTMEEVIAGPIAPRRTTALLVAIFGSVGLLLAVVGVYGVTAYDVARRTREFGIRLALGAKPTQLLRAATADGLLVGAIGVACGLAGAWLLIGGLESLVYGISPRDPVSFVMAPLILVVAALFGVLMPSLRALRVDAAVTMRAE